MKAADDREEALLREALQRAKGPEREAFLNEACAGNQALHAKLDGLLLAQESPGPLPEPPPAKSLPESGAPPPQQPTVRCAPVTEKPGDKIGHYKLLQHIGEGGCGVVYMAEQQEPIRRRVAFKVIKLGMDTREVVARFEAERQALALMDHPNIAKVLDAGATESGRPYFVMELVRGIKITHYCDQNNLSTAERLDLFVQICQAIQHAHQKGIIHRDIKPSNILVTLQDPDKSGVPKVIDFGIAKATGGQVLTDKTLFTAYEQFMGTPAYMSPEQAEMSGLDIDTRSDIYSLGVLLYELLTGQTPFAQKDLVAAGLDGMRRIIREKEPARPSTRLTDELVGADVRRLHSKSEVRNPESEEEIRASSRRLLRIKETIPLLQGDLDWIVMKCLEKDRTRRYETASGLAQDILNHLSNEPVTARPPSRAYRLQKLVRRNKLAFAAAGAVTAALLIGLGLSTWLFLKEKDARRRAVAAEQSQSQLRQQAEASAKKARDEARRSEQTALFLKDMLNGVGPSVARGRDTQMLREILDKAAERVGKDLKDSPEVEADLRTTIGDVYRALWQYPKAEEMYRPALGTNRILWGDLSTNVADSLERLSRALYNQQNLAEAEPLVVEALTIRTNLLGNENPNVAVSLRQLANLRMKPGRFAEAEELYRQSLAILRKVVGNDSLDVVKGLQSLCDALLPQGKAQEAESAAREAVAIAKRLVGDEGSDWRWGTQKCLGSILYSLGKLDEAEPLLRGTVTNAARWFPNDFASWRWTVYDFFDLLYRQGKQADAYRVISELLTPELVKQPRDEALLEFRAYLSARGGRWKESAADYARLVEIVPTDHWPCHQVAPVLVISGDHEAYRQLCRRMLARAGSIQDAGVSQQMALDCLMLPPSDADVPTLDRLAEFAVKSNANGIDAQWCQLTKGLAEYRQGHFAEGVQWAQRALVVAGEVRERDAQAYALLAMAQHQLQHADEARAALGKAVEITQTKLPQLESGDLGPAWDDLARAHILLREAKALLEGEAAATKR